MTTFHDFFEGMQAGVISLLGNLLWSAFIPVIMVSSPDESKAVAFLIIIAISLGWVWFDTRCMLSAPLGTVIGCIVFTSMIATADFMLGLGIAAPAVLSILIGYIKYKYKRNGSNLRLLTEHRAKQSSVNRTSYPDRVMNNELKARILIDALNQYNVRSEQIRSDLDSDYSPTRYYINANSKSLSDLIELTRETFSDDPFVTEFLEIGNDIGSADHVISFLQNYLKYHRPAFMDNLLENAEYLRDEGLLECAALCIRLYCETALNQRFDGYDFKNSKTLGQRYKKVKDQLKPEQFEDYGSFIDRLNKIVHNDGLDLKPTCNAEITSMIKKARKFEDYIQQR